MLWMPAYIAVPNLLNMISMVTLRYCTKLNELDSFTVKLIA
jgi:hypothetical protein